MPESTVRKEFELTPDEAETLARVAAKRGCSEDAVVRAAIERLEHAADDDGEWEWIGALRVSKLRKLTDKEKAHRSELERWLAEQPPIGLTQAVIDERESGY